MIRDKFTSQKHRSAIAEEVGALGGRKLNPCTNDDTQRLATKSHDMAILWKILTVMHSLPTPLSKTTRISRSLSLTL